MRKLFIIFMLLSTLVHAYGRTAIKCTPISGKIVQFSGQSLYKFIKARKTFSNKYVASHTKFYIQSIDGINYQVIFNNLNYSWITSTQAITNKDIGIIQDLQRNYPAGSHVVACGKVISNGNNYSINFVDHSVCINNKMNTYLKINGSNIIDNNQYCNT